MIADSIVWKTLTSHTQDSSPTHYTHSVSLPLRLHMKHTQNTFSYMCCQDTIADRQSGSGFPDVSFPDGCNVALKKNTNPGLGISSGFVSRVCFVRVEIGSSGLMFRALFPL